MSSPAQIGAYQVVAELGRGGMGVVYEVTHPGAPGRSLALKLILPERVDAASLERFRREGELLARVRHPAVVTVHELGQDSSGLFLVTDRVEGEALQDRLRRGPLPPAEAAALVASLAEATDAVHQAGVLHRDLKPHNVIVRPDGSPVLLDFGVALDPSADRLTQTGVGVGTPAFAAPEQLNGERDLDARCDVYGLGAILFACLSARPPFTARGFAIIKQVLEDEPRWPSQDDPGVPASLEAICRRCLAKDPAQRYGTCAELSAALGAWTPHVRGVRRPQLWVGALATSLLLAALLTAVRGFPPTQTPTTPSAGTTDIGAVDSQTQQAPPPTEALGAQARRLAAATPGQRFHRVAFGAREEVSASFVDDRRLFLRSKTRGLLWNLDEDAAVHAWTFPSQAYASALLPDESVLVAHGALVVRLDLRSGGARIIATFPKPTTGLAASADGRWLAVGSHEQIYLLDLSRDPVGREQLDEHPRWIQEMTISQDGAWLAVSSGSTFPSPALVRAYRLPDGTRGLERKGSAKSTGLRFHPRRPLLAIGDNLRSLTITPAAGGAPRGFKNNSETEVALAHGGKICALRFSPDGARLYSLAGENRPTGEIACWNVETGEERWSDRSLPFQVCSLDLSPDGRALVIGAGDGRALLWRTPR